MWLKWLRWINLLSPSLMLFYIPTVRRPYPQGRRGGKCMPTAPTTLSFTGGPVELCGSFSPHQQYRRNQRDQPRFEVAF